MAWLVQSLAFCRYDGELWKVSLDKKKKINKICRWLFKKTKFQCFRNSQIMSCVLITTLKLTDVRRWVSLKELTFSVFACKIEVLISNSSWVFWIKLELSVGSLKMAEFPVINISKR
jgi:hypothetical protein